MEPRSIRDGRAGEAGTERLPGAACAHEVARSAAVREPVRVAARGVPGEPDDVAAHVVPSEPDDVAAHEAAKHGSAHVHHGHSHASSSHHAGGHHLLQVEDLTVSFSMYDAGSRSFFKAKKVESHVIERLSISVHVGEIVAVVGASGSGKTLLADAILGLYEPNASVSGRIWFDGVLQDARSLAALRGNGISLVPQSVNHLDPLMKVGRQVRGFSGDAKEREAVQRRLFARYGLGEEVADLYPFELSGGMARRVLLSCALIDNPKLIVADEPTPGLDLDLAVAALDDFRAFADQGGGVLLITHDIELALRVADRVAVFKDGTVVEETAVANFASHNTLMHPFSKELWHALPEHGFEVVS
ncbi:ATP-binding cassette domain-containing protein [Raoultibacter phocaeensis]|uniref:ATP-binding cassette domain-containing protein n=1 Tax=Raoultibacter phocaeensis TaxID=2479841 RepID=UPI001117FC4C|nr:ATP-binding cassette domain-containing protein [Raoultibacter phocaeensis]